MRCNPLSLGVVAGVVLAAGCPSVTYSPTAAHITPHAPVAPSEIEIILEDHPTRPYMLVGYFETHNAKADKSLAMMRDKAAAAGLDGLCSIVCGAPGTIGQNNCTGQGFMWIGDR